jgi:preprotein translocase subunit YajC
MILVLGGCAPTAADGSSTAGAGGYSSIIMILAVVVMFYFFAIRPESKRKKKAQEMRNSLEAGDNITTIGGIVGKIIHVTEDKITFETGEDRVRIETVKWAVSENRGKGASKTEGESSAQ